jgi:hypothetical protein
VIVTGVEVLTALVRHREVRAARSRGHRYTGGDHCRRSSLGSVFNEYGDSSPATGAYQAQLGGASLWSCQLPRVTFRAEPPIIFAASETWAVDVLPTSAGNTSSGTPMTFIASVRGMVESPTGCSGMVWTEVTFGMFVIASRAWAQRGTEASASAVS